MAQLAMRFDMRTPSFSPADRGALYRTALEQAAWADEHGFAVVTVSEHHGVDDGYLSSPLVLAAAMAGCTEQVPISVSACLVPLHDPLRLAEDIAVLNLASGGRATVIAGLGYRPEEYALMGKDWATRGALMDEVLDTLLKAWTGEPFEYQGRTVRITPTPLSPPEWLLFVGASGPAGARRAARFGLGFCPSHDDPALRDLYLGECEKHGTTPGIISQPQGLAYVYVSDDPDQTWAEIGEYVFYESSVYASWQQPGLESMVTDHARSVDELRANGKYRVMTPDETIAYMREHRDHVLTFHPLIGGMPPELSWPSLELLAGKVLPEVQGR